MDDRFHATFECTIINLENELRARSIGNLSCRVRHIATASDVVLGISGVGSRRAVSIQGSALDRSPSILCTTARNKGPPPSKISNRNFYFINECFALKKKKLNHLHV